MKTKTIFFPFFSLFILSMIGCRVDGADFPSNSSSSCSVCPQEYSYNAQQQQQLRQNLIGAYLPGLHYNSGLLQITSNNILFVEEVFSYDVFFTNSGSPILIMINDEYRVPMYIETDASMAVTGLRAVNPEEGGSNHFTKLLETPPAHDEL